MAGLKQFSADYCLCSGERGGGGEEIIAAIANMTLRSPFSACSIRHRHCTSTLKQHPRILGCKHCSVLGLYIHAVVVAWGDFFEGRSTLRRSVQYGRMDAH